MKEILGLLKKYIFGICCVVVLIILQANCDLALPEYTSNIINVGIQQQGVENAVPKVIRKNSLESISVIAKDKTIIDNYELIEKGNEEYIDEYPILKNTSVYILKEDNEDKLTELEEKIIIPEMFYYAISTSKEIKDMGVTITSNTLPYLLFGEGTNPLKEMYKSFNEMDSELANQYAINFVKDEYKTVGYDLEELQMNYLFKTGTKMILFAFLIMGIIIVSTYLSGRIASSFAYDLREKVVKKIISYSNSEFNEFSTASLITRTTNDISQVQMIFTMCMRILLFAPIIGIGAMFKVAGIDMTWVIGCAIGAILVLIITLMIFALPKFKIIQKLIDRINLVVRETLNGLPVIRAFANEKFEKNKFDKANTDLMKVNLFTQRLMAIMSPLMTIIMNGTIVLIYWIGAERVDLGTLQVGDLTALITYTMHIIMSFLMISMLSIMLPRAIIAINRIKEVLNKKSSIEEIENPIKLDKSKTGLVEFNNVSFKYPDGDEMIVEDLSFTCEPGTTTAIIGSTGSGKSTVVNLIPRFFDVTKGEVKVSGVNVKDASLEELRSVIGVVPQKGLLFSGTIESNIKFSDQSMSDEQMIKAAEIACAAEFINKKDERYLSPISQGGTNVSGGQRQRLSIARAVAKNPDIYIFDDSFSALDYKTDSNVRKNLNEYCGNATKIIIAQRVATIMNADQIIVLEQGKVVGIGTHKELYQNCKIYKDIALSQLKEEELV